MNLLIKATKHRNRSLAADLLICMARKIRGQRVLEVKRQIEPGRILYSIK